MSYILFGSLLIFVFFRIRFLFLFFQQKEYRNKWFLDYMFTDLRLIDKKLSFILFITYYVQIYYIPIVFLIFGLNEFLILKRAKKKLIITSRVKRIFSLSIILTLIFFYIVYGYFTAFSYNFLFTSILIIQFLPFSLIFANLLLWSHENKQQNVFLKQALDKLHKIRPVIIGITGSMGKTSTKHILAHILGGTSNTIYTPGSVNTKMGITAFINTKLTENCEYFIVEMGAYFVGSIKSLCDFVDPDHGIITAIGDSHYEYFKNRENIASAKFELGEHVRRNNGRIIINDNQIDKDLIPKMPVIKIGKIENIRQTKEGLYFNYKDEEVFAPIYGVHQATNIALAIEMAWQLGMPMASILTILKTLPQISHRLEVSKRDANITIIDDAYNSNFEGFKSALDFLQTFNNGRKILITPGMVELGEKHNERHFEIGKIAAVKTDIVIVVKPDRIPTFIEGLNVGGNHELITFSTFSDAQKWMTTNLKADDTVLLENDLPDIYESSIIL
jgi:UDP-N-acetylmuramoyl-tripeptide--D-alanyl-D-alanine ligase